MYPTADILMRAVNGQQTLSDPIESSVDKEVRVVLGVPVLKNGEVVGIFRRFL